MRNKQSSTLEKTVKLFAKAMCFAILFSLVFSIVFTSGTVFDFSSTSMSIENNQAYAATMEPDPAGIKDAEILERNIDYAQGDIELNASHFVDSTTGENPTTFPEGKKWRISTADGNKLTFNNTSNWRNSMSFRGDLNGESAGVVSAVNQPQWTNGQPYTTQKNYDDNSSGNIQLGVPFKYIPVDKDNNPTSEVPVDGYKAKGFTVQASNVNGYVVLGTVLKIKNSPFIEQLIYDNRYTVKARLRQRAHYMQSYSRTEAFLPLKVRVEATGNVPVNDEGNYDVNGQFTSEFQANHMTDVFNSEHRFLKLTGTGRIDKRKEYYEGLGFRYSDTWVDSNKEHSYDHGVASSDVGGEMWQEQQCYSKGFKFNSSNNKIDEATGFDEQGTMVLTPDTPYITCEYLCGYAAGVGDYPMKNNNVFRVWDMAVEYEITRNTTPTASPIIRDGASPRPIYVDEESIKPFSPSADLSYGWPVYNDNANYINALKQTAPVDSVYADYTNKIPNDVIVLSSYVRKEKGNTDKVWKSIKVKYEDKYFYPGDKSESVNKNTHAGGIKEISFSGLLPDNETNPPVKFDGEELLTVPIGDMSSGATIALKLNNKDVGNIVITRLSKKEIEVEYNFKENITINIKVSDYSDIDTDKQMEQTIIVNGIDENNPNPLLFNEVDPSMMSGIPSSITKWYDKEFVDFSLNPNDSNDVSDLGNAKYAWFVQVIKSETGFFNPETGVLNDIFNSYIKYQELKDGPAASEKAYVDQIAGQTFLQIQGVNPFVGLTYDFKTGMFDINGVKSAPTEVTGSGYYGFYFYTIDLAGHTVDKREPTKVFLKTDYINPKYTIQTDAPSDYFNNNGKVSGSKWSYQDFRLVLRVENFEGAPLNSFSGNYIKFVYNDRLNVLAFNEDGFLRFNDYYYNETNPQEGFALYDNLGNIIKRNPNYTRESITLLNYSIKFWKNGQADPTQKLANKVDNKGREFTSVGTQLIFEFGVIEKKVNSSINFTVGIGDGKNDALEWTDLEYRCKDNVNATSAQERGVKILVDSNVPNGVSITGTDGDFREGLIDLNVYKDLVTNQSILKNRIWNTTGNMELKLSVDQDSHVFVIVTNANNLRNENTSAENDIYLQELLRIFAGGVGPDGTSKPKKNVSTLDEVEQEINAIFRKAYVGYNRPAMVLSTSDTTRGTIAINVPMFVEQFNNGIRNIYMFTVSESGRMSSIKTGSVLVDTRTYTINAKINDEATQYFAPTIEQASVCLKKKGITTTKFKRGDIVTFNFTFDKTGYIPYSLVGKANLNDIEDIDLFYNVTKNNTAIPWGTKMEENGDNLLFSYNENNQVQLLVDSLDNLIDGLIPTPIGNNQEAKEPTVEYILNIKKNVEFGISGLALKDGKYVGDVIVRQNAKGADAPFWASDMNILDKNVSGDNNLKILYYENNGENPLVGAPTGITSANTKYTVSAYVDDNNMFYVSNIRNLTKIPITILLQQLVIVAKESFGYYGTNPTFNFVLRDHTGKEITLTDVNNNNKPIDGSNYVDLTEDDIRNCLTIQNPYNCDDNRIPVGQYDIIGEQEAIKTTFKKNYDVSVESAKYNVQPKQLRVEDFGTIVGDEVSWNVEYKFMAKKPDICFFISQDQLKDFSAELETIFYNCDYISTITNSETNTTYYAFKDSYDSIYTLNNLTKYSAPNNYAISNDTSAIQMSKNFDVLLPADKYITIENRSTLQITTEPQTIYVNDINDLDIDNKYVKFKLTGDEDLLNAAGYIDLSDYNPEATIKFTLEKDNSGLYKIVGIKISDANIAAGFNDKTIATFSQEANITLKVMGGVESDKDHLIYVRQKSPITFEYEQIEKGVAFTLSNISSYFEVLLYTKDAGKFGYESSTYLNLDLNITIGEANENKLPSEHEYLPVGTYAVTNLTGVDIKLQGSDITNVTAVIWGEGSVEIKVTKKVVFVVPLLDYQQNGAGQDVFGVPYFPDTADDKTKIDHVITDRAGKPDVNITVNTGEFERALFNKEGFIRFGLATDGILTNSDLHYGIIEKEPFTTLNENYEIVFDSTRTVYKKNGDKREPTNVACNEVQLQIFPHKVIIDELSFNKDAIKGKEYDGTDIYYIDNYASLLNIKTTKFFENYIIYDIKYSDNGVNSPLSVPGDNSSRKVYVIISNVRIAGNLDTAGNINIITDKPEYRFEKTITAKNVVVSANDFKIVKEFDGTNDISEVNVIPADSIKNFKFEVPHYIEGNINKLNTIYVGDFNKIDEFVIAFTLDENSGLLTFDVSTDKSIQKETRGDKVILRIKNKQATVTKVKVSSKDFENIYAVGDRVYKDNDSSIDLQFTFNEAFNNKLSALTKIFTYITPDIGLKLTGTIPSPNAGANIPVVITNATMRGNGQNFNEASTFFELDLGNIKESYDNKIFADVHKAVISMELSHKAYKYGDIIDVMKKGEEYSLKHGSTVVAKFTVIDFKLSDKGQENNNVNIEDFNYNHNILVTGTITNESGINVDNYILGGYLYRDQNYILLEQADQSNKMSALNGEKVSFEILNAITLLPVEIVLTNEEVFNTGKTTMAEKITKTENGTINVGVEGNNITKVYDGNTNATFTYKRDEATPSVKITGNYNSINVAAIKPVSFSKVEVVSDDPQQVNNYEIVNNLRTINGSITPRKVYATSIELKDYEFNNDIAITDKTYSRPGEVTSNDISVITWGAANATSPDDLKSGFIGGDMSKAKVSITNVKYNTPTNELAVNYNNEGTLKPLYNAGVLDQDFILPIGYKFKVIDDNQTSISNYTLVCDTLIGRIVPKEVYADFVITGGYEKPYDGNNTLTVEGLEYTINIPGYTGELDVNNIAITLEYESAEAGTRKVNILVDWSENAAAKAKNYKLINTGISSAFGKINQRVIYYELDDVNKVYGDKTITPKYTFYEDTDKDAKLNPFTLQNGIPYDASGKDVIYNGYGFDKTQMPTLPSVKILNDTQYTNKDNGSTEKNFIFAPIAPDAEGKITGTITPIEKDVYVYVTQRYKDFGAKLPTPELKISGSKDGYTNGFANFDNFNSVFSDIKGEYVFDNEHNIYRLQAYYYVSQDVKQNITSASPYTVKGKYKVYLHSLNSDESQRLLVNIPKINLTLRDAISVNYNSENLITSIFNQQDLSKYAIEYYFQGSTQQITEIINAGTYKVMAKATLKPEDTKAQTTEISQSEIEAHDRLVLGADANKAQQIYTKANGGDDYCTLTIKKIRPAIYLDKKEFKYQLGHVYDETEIKNHLKIEGYKEAQPGYLNDLKDNYFRGINLMYRPFDSKEFVKTELSYNKAGVYEVTLTFGGFDANSNFKLDPLDNGSLKVKGYIQIEKARLLMKQDEIGSNLVYEEGKKDYVKGHLLDNSFKDGKLAAQYIGGLYNDYDFEIHSIGTYKYRFIIVDENGKYNQNYEVYVKENGKERPAEGMNLVIGRKEIGDKLSSGKNVTVKTSDNSPANIEYLTYNLLLDSNGPGWDTVNNYVNNMSGLKSSNSKLTAIINLGYKVSNGQNATDLDKDLLYSVKVPEVLNTAKNLQVFYRDSENKLVELEGCVLKNGALTFESKPISQLVIVTEQEPTLPVWGIVLIVFAVLGAVGISIAVAIVSIKSKKGLI